MRWTEVTAKLTARWPRRWRLYTVLSVFPVLSFALVWWLFSPGGVPWADDEPPEGFYWSAAQYQIAFGKFREQLLVAAAAGSALAPVDVDELTMRGDVLLSKGKLLTEPSITRSSLESIPGFTQSAAEIVRFDDRVIELLQKLERSSLERVDALATLEAMSRVDTTVLRFVNAARQREVDGRTTMFRSFEMRERAALLAALVGWALLMAWFGWILLAHRSKKHLANERLRALDAERLAKDQLQQAVNTRAQFLSMVSHELRSPLQAIVSSVDVLDLQIPPSERRNAIQRIRRSALMLGLQLRDLLTIARGEAGWLEINPESFEAGAFVREVADVAAHVAHHKGMAFHVIVPEEPVFARADVQRISQVLANLVSNAVRYTRTGSVSLALEPPQVEVGGDRAGPGRLVFVVSDTGPGLPASAMRLLTEAEPDAPDLLPRRDGSGVGLMIVRTVVEHLEGVVSVSTTPGSGTRFIITIPVILEDPDEVPTGATADGLVLVVDDEAEISASVVALVNGLGHPCHVASSGNRAASLLAQQAYETAFIDLDLPEIGGVELARRTRGVAGPNQTSYLVAMTAFRPEVEDGLFDEILIKPVESLRVQWHLAHRSRALTAGRGVAPASPPAGP